MSYTPAQVDILFRSILQRPADLAAVQAFSGRPNDQDAQIRTQIESSQEALVNVDPVVRLYQGAFGRLPDSAGLQANVSTFVNGYNATSLATSFLAGPEAAGVFGSANPAVTTSFVQTIYNNALARSGDTTELNYWVGTGKSAGQVLAEISNSQEAVNKTNIPVVSFLDAQATSALNGTNASVTGTLYNQTATNTTFTAGNDVIVGSVNADTLNQAGATPGTTTTTVLAANVNAGDTINGGGGVDTLTIDQTAGAPAVPGTINSLEVINLVGAQNNTLNFSNANGLALFTLRNDATAGQTDAITLKGGVLFGLDNVTGGATATETAIFTGATTTFGSVAVANGTNVGTVNLNNTGITTLNVLSTGSAGSTTVNTIGTLASDGTVTTINVSGDKAVTIGGFANTVTKFDATNLTGANLTVTLGTQDIAVTGGSGNDKFIFGATLNTADTVVGGAGTDTVQVTGADYSAAANATLTALNTKVSGVEQLEFVGAGATTIDGNTFTNTAITNLLFNTTAALDTINNAGSARLYSFGATNTGDATFTLKSGATAVNLSLEAAALDPVAIGTLTVNAAADAAAGTVSTVNITSNLAAGAAATAANTITAFTATAGSTLNLGGAQALTLDADTNGGTISGGAFTGKFTLTGGSNGNNTILLGSGGSDLTTGTGVDNVSVAGGTNVVNLGAGNDFFTGTAGTNTITGGTGADSITLGSGADRVVYTVAGNSTAATPATTLDTVTSFTAGTDKFVVGITVAAVQQGSAYTAAGTGNLSTDIGTALVSGGGATGLGVNNAAVVTITGANAGTYVVVNDVTAASTNYTAADTVIKLAGLSGTLATTDFTV